jgi:hypothetical protein
VDEELTSPLLWVEDEVVEEDGLRLQKLLQEVAWDLGARARQLAHEPLHAQVGGCAPEVENVLHCRLWSPGKHTQGEASRKRQIDQARARVQQTRRSEASR